MDFSFGIAWSFRNSSGGLEGLVIKSSKATKKRRRMVLKLDADARQRVFERDNFACMRCGKKENLNWAHVLSRRDISLRWEADNGMTLDAGCHMFWHHQPALAVDWLQKNHREQWDRLMALHVLNPKVNIRERFEELSQ